MILIPKIPYLLSNYLQMINKELEIALLLAW